MFQLCLVAGFAQSRKEPPAKSAETTHLVDITASTGIHFDHLSSPEARYIVESMSGGVAIIDYDNDGYPDLYFTNAPSVAMYKAGTRARGALYHNNHDGTFTDVTDKAGVGYPCWAMGVAVGDFDNDGWPDLAVSCFDGVVLYHNNHDGTFTDVTKKSGLDRDKGWATGLTFGDYDNDGFVDLFVPHYVDLNLNDLPVFGKDRTCTYHGIAVQCGPRGLKGSPDALYHNNGDGTFTDVSQKAGVDDPQKYFGLQAVWSDLDNDGRIDLFVANDGEPNYLYHNEGNGHFKDVAMESGVALSEDGSEQANMGVALGDYTHTGRAGIAITHFSEDYAILYRNDGTLNFTDVAHSAHIAQPTVSYVGWGDAFLDTDNRGWLDFLMVNGHVYPQVDQGKLGITFREPKLLFWNQRRWNIPRHQQRSRDDAKRASGKPRLGSRRSLQHRPAGRRHRKPDGRADDPRNQARPLPSLGKLSTRRFALESSSLERSHVGDYGRRDANERSAERQQLSFAERHPVALRIGPSTQP